MFLPSLPPDLLEPQPPIVYNISDDNLYKSSLIDDSFNIISPCVLAIDVQIIKRVENLGYTVADVQEDFFNDMGKNFQVITVEIYQEISDYAHLLQQEKEISKSLSLYDKNIILELV